MVQLHVAEAAALLAGMILGKPGPPAELIADLRERKPDLYTTRTIDASVARDKVEFNVAGAWLYVNEDTASVDVEVRLNENDKAPLNLSKLKLISLPFYRFFITNAAGSGSMEIVIGKTGMMVSPSEVDIEVVASEIMLPIDIQGAYIMMPVDIQAQYITLDIDIVAQTVGNISVDIAAQTLGNIAIDIAAQTVGSIAVNLAASDITLNVNISSQTANLNVDIKASSVTLTVTVSGTAEIDIEAQSVGIYLQPDWGAKTGIDKNFFTLGADKTWKQTETTEYTVPSGKELYIYGLAIAIDADVATDYDHFLYVKAWLNVGAVSKLMIGGLGGGQVQLTKPLVITENVQYQQLVSNEANLTCNIFVSSWGVEITL